MSQQLKVLEKPRPPNVGILALEVYFPKSYVDQSALETYYKIPKGKCTIGYGLQQMGFCYDNEDINSLCLTVVARLMEKYNISYNDIGRLEVGTQTVIDKSKSVKSVLMSLFKESGNYNVEGVDARHACYGGTNALFNAVSWVESRSWDGRYALVVCGDFALYETDLSVLDGVGSVALLIGPNAPLVIEPGLRASCMNDYYDFCKPNLSSPYPIMEKEYGLKNYFAALDFCYNLYCSIAQKALNTKDSSFSLEKFDYILSHASCPKLSRKTIDCLAMNDFAKSKNNDSSGEQGIGDEHQNPLGNIDSFKYTSLSESLTLGKIDKTFEDSCQKLYENKAYPSVMLLQRVGGMHNATLYGCLASLLVNVCSENLIGKRIGMISYGAGVASTMFSVFLPSQTNQSTNVLTNNLENSFSLHRLVTGLSDLKCRLDGRTCKDPGEYATARLRMEEVHGLANYRPIATPECLFPSTYYLVSVENYKRTYKRTSRQEDV